MSRPQEVSLARLLRVYESKMVSSSGRVGFEDAGFAFPGESQGSPSGAACLDGSLNQKIYSENRNVDGGVIDGGTQGKTSCDVLGVPSSSEVIIPSTSHAQMSPAKTRQHLTAMRGFLNNVWADNPDAAEAYAGRVAVVAAWVGGASETNDFATSAEISAFASSGGGVSGRRRQPSANDNANFEKGTDQAGVTGTAPATTADGISSASPRTYVAQHVCANRHANTSPPERSSPRAETNGTKTGIKRRTRLDGGAPLVLSHDGQGTLARHREAQDGLADDLVSLAGAIRENAAAMERSLAQSRAGLDSLESGLDRNVDAGTAGRGFPKSGGTLFLPPLGDVHGRH